MQADYLKMAEDMFPVNDNDYIQTCLYKAVLSEEQLKLWTVAFSWFLHAGVAAFLASHPDQFYSLTWDEFDTFPRASERRHFRGEKARKAVRQHVSLYPDASAACDDWFAGRTWEAFCDATKNTVQMGTYMRAQVYDTAQVALPRWGLAPVAPEALKMWKPPQAGAKLLAQEGEDIVAVTKRLIREMSHIPAPPSYKEPVGAGEVETVLCRLKKYRAGRYTVGDDIEMVKQQLTWRDSTVARELWKGGFSSDYPNSGQ